MNQSRALLMDIDGSLDALLDERAERLPLARWNGSVRIRDQIPSRP